jgi:hypothetical protein
MPSPVDDVSGGFSSQSIKKNEEISSHRVGKSFDSYMARVEGESCNIGATSTPSPFDLAKNGSMQNGNFSFGNLQKTASAAQTMLGGIRTQLNTPKIKLKESDKQLIRSKLTVANEFLHNAKENLKKTFPNISHADPYETKKTQSIEESSSNTGNDVLEKILGFVSQGESNVRSIQNLLMQIKNSGTAIHPGDFLHVQIKLGHAQQLMEFSSTILSKTIDSMKTLFNIQI